MASFEDLSFDWSTLCQECPECWTASVISVIWIVLTNHRVSMNYVMPKPIHKYKYGYVCGSDFETYPTRVNFWKAQERDPELYVLHRGKCKKLCQIYAPVCANDGRTYHNECQLEYARKNYDKKLQAVYMGTCSPYKAKSKKYPKKHKLYFHTDYYVGDSEEDPVTHRNHYFYY